MSVDLGMCYEPKPYYFFVYSCWFIYKSGADLSVNFRNGQIFKKLQQ